MAQNDNMKKILNELSKSLNVPSSQLEYAAKSGNLSQILENSDDDKAQQIKDILSSPEKTKQIMQSPQARQLLKLLGEK